MARIHRGLWISLCVPLLLPACGRDEEPEPLVRPVRYVQVFTSGARVRTFSGVAQAAMETPLSFRVSGTVFHLPVEVGDHVRTRQLIAELDPEDYRLQQQDAEAGFRRAEAEARNAGANHNRVRGLYETDNASLNELDAARTAFESATELVRSAENRLELARRQLVFTRLTAPQGGAIAAVNVEVNENVRSGQVIALLTSGARLEVNVAVPEVLIAQIRESMEVMVRFDALPGQVFPALVTEVGVASTRVVTTFPVTVRLDREEQDIRSGMAAEVGFRFGTPGGGNMIVVPPVVVGEDQDGRFVYTVEPADSGYGVVRRRTVTVGELTSDGLEILEGLADEDRVITAGMSQVTDGLRVKI